MLISGGSFILATCLMWEIAAGFAPLMSGAFLCLFLIGNALLIEVGNPAGIAVSLCLIAAWCFLKERHVSAGVTCLAISLLIKPHDAAFVWLYFLLAGGIQRRRALQTLLLTVILGLTGIVWVSHVAPNWMPEMHDNMLATSARGGANDPGPASVEPRWHGAIIVNLQSAISVLRDDPRIYNPATYLLCAPLLLVWMVAALRKRCSAANAWMALAAVSALSMLPLYHRQHDAAILLLTVPACAILWSEGGPTAGFALLFTALGAVFTSNLTLQFLAAGTAGLRASVSGLPSQILTVLLCRPAPIVMLAIGIFYLWVYTKRSSPQVAQAE